MIFGIIRTVNCTDYGFGCMACGVCVICKDCV